MLESYVRLKVGVRVGVKDGMRSVSIRAKVRARVSIRVRTFPLFPRSKSITAQRKVRRILNRCVVQNKYVFALLFALNVCLYCFLLLDYLLLLSSLLFSLSCVVFF